MKTFKEYLYSVSENSDIQEAFMSQEHKKELEPNIKKVLSKYGVKGSIKVRNHSTLVVTLTQGKIDFNEDYVESRAELSRRGDASKPDKHFSSVNVYWVKDQWKGKAKDFLTELVQQMKGEKYFDKSDIQSDYFHTSHYFDIKIGRSINKPYEVK